MHVHALEGRVQEHLDQAFAAAGSTVAALDLLHQFNDVLQVCVIFWGVLFL